jgi:hypothetical protein
MESHFWVRHAPQALDSSSHRDADARAATLSRRTLLRRRARAEAVGALPARSALGVGDTGAARALGASLPAAALAIGRTRAAYSVYASKPEHCTGAKGGLVAVGERRTRTAHAGDACLPSAIGARLADTALPPTTALSCLTVGRSRARAGTVLASRRRTGAALTVGHAVAADACHAREARLTVAVRAASGYADAGDAHFAGCAVAVDGARALQRRMSWRALGARAALTVGRACSTGAFGADLARRTLSVRGAAPATDAAARGAGVVRLAQPSTRENRPCPAVAPYAAAGVRGALRTALERPDHAAGLTGRASRAFEKTLSRAARGKRRAIAAGLTRRSTLSGAIAGQ